ncbi:MAG: hypothetical protein RLZZ436_2585 [Planctomycetota bacterium]
MASLPSGCSVSPRRKGRLKPDFPANVVGAWFSPQSRAGRWKTAGAGTKGQMVFGCALRTAAGTKATADADANSVRQPRLAEGVPACCSHRPAWGICNHRGHRVSQRNAWNFAKLQPGREQECAVSSLSVSTALYPQAAARRLSARPHFSLLTSHFPLLSTFYPLLSRAAWLPPNGIGFLVFRMLWMTRALLKRLDPIMQGVRSMSTV